MSHETPGCGFFVFCFVFPALAVLSLRFPLCCIGEQIVLFLRAAKRGRGRAETGLSKSSQSVQALPPLHYLLCLVAFPQLNRDCRAFIGN